MAQGYKLSLKLNCFSIHILEQEYTLGKDSPVPGKYNLNCRYKDKAASLGLQVVDFDAQAVLGLRTVTNLNFVQRLDLINTHPEDQWDAGTDNKDTFQGLACFNRATLRKK